jgi:hydroxymethylglutaryl-CoA lyase
MLGDAVSFVRIVEVGPRDGLQNEPKNLILADRLSLIDRLAVAGLPSIEIGAMVSPKWVPQMVQSDQVIAQISPLAQSRDCPVLVPNARGMQDAVAAGARSVAVFVAASESFSQKNTNSSIEQSLSHVAEIATMARHHDIRLRGYISCVVGCPFEGVIDPIRVGDVADALLNLGCVEISLGDTIGIATPRQVENLLKTLRDRLGVAPLAAHFHDSYGQALANILVALEYGITTIDSAVAGLGGCPYAPGAGGNVATEDVVYMLNGMGIETGVDFAELVATGQWISNLLGRPYTARAGLAWSQQQSRAS